MARPRHYSPVISRFLVSVLYHQARHQKIPMTQLVDDLLTQALRGSSGWATATDLSTQEAQGHSTLPKAA